MAYSSHPTLILSDRKQAKNKTRGTRYSNVGNLRVITDNCLPQPQNNSETCEIPHTMFPQSQFLQYPQQISQPVYSQQIPQSIYPQQIPQAIYTQQIPQPSMYLQNQMPQPEYMQSQIPPPGYLFPQVSPVNINAYDHPQMDISPSFESMNNFLSDNKAENFSRRKRGGRNINNRNVNYWQKPVETGAEFCYQKRNRYRKKRKFELKSQQNEPKSQQNEPESQQNEPESQQNESKPQQKIELKSQKIEPKSQQKIEPKSQQKKEPKIHQKNEPKIHQKNEPRTQQKNESKSQQKNEPNSQQKNKYGQNKNKYGQNKNKYGQNKNKYGQNKNKYGQNKNKYNWYNKKYKNAYEKLSNNLMDNLDEISDGPLEDEAFEEVEVASASDDNKNIEISVGFRKSKPIYLKGKGVGFFKPKVVKLSQTKTFVKCSNAESQEDIEEVDLVSDTEDNHTNLENINSNFQGVYPNLDIPSDHENVHPDLQNIDLDLEDVSDVEYEEVVADSDEFLNENMLIIDDDEDSEENLSPIMVKELSEIPQIDKKQHSELKQSEICKTPADLYQGKAIYQDSLDKWNSHLIGLEYILEIWDKPGGHVKHYHCILCNEDISVPKSFVSNKFIAVHVGNNKHMSSYIEKHFPSCGYKLTDDGPNVGSNVLKNYCEELESKFQRKSVFITNSGYFIENLMDIKSVLDKVFHWTEKEFMLDILQFNQKQEVAPIQQDLKTSHSSSVTVVKEVIKEVKECESNKADMEEEKPGEGKENLRVNKDGVESIMMNLVNVVSTNETENVNNAEQDKSLKTTNNEIAVIEKEVVENKTTTTGRGRRPRRLPIPRLPAYQLLFKASQVNSKQSNKTDKNQSSGKPATNVLEPSLLISKKNTDIYKASQVSSKQLNKTCKKPNSKNPAIKVMQPSLIIPDRNAGVISDDPTVEVEPSKIQEVTKELKPLESKLSVLVNPRRDVVNVKPSVSTGLRVITQLKEQSLSQVKPAVDEVVLKPSVSTELKKKYQQKTRAVAKKTSLIHSKHCVRRFYKKINTTAINRDSAHSKIGIDNEADVLIISTESEKDESKHVRSEHLENQFPSGKSSGAPHSKSSPKDIKTTATTKGMHSDFHKYRSKEHTKIHVQNRSRSPLENVLENLLVNTEKTKDHIVKGSEISINVFKSSEKNIPKSPIKKLLKIYERKQSKSPEKQFKTVDQHRSRSPRRRRQGSPNKHSISSSRRASKSPAKHSRSSSHQFSNRIKKPDDENSVHSKSSSYQHSKSSRRSRSPKEHRERNTISHKSKSPKRETIGSRIDKMEAIGSKIDRFSKISTHEKYPRIASEKYSQKLPVVRHSRSSVDKHSRSSVDKHSRSPLRKNSRSPIKRYSRSPVRRYSKSPNRRYAKSPIRRYSKSPIRRQSPIRRHSKSPTRRQSPIRRHSKSPRRFSRSPLRRKSRSPIRRRSRSPFRKYSRNIGRKHSRSPVRRRSRSSERYSSSFERLLSSIDSGSRSTFDAHIRSSFERISRSPKGRRSLSPRAQRSMSPYRRYSKSSAESISITSLGPTRHSRSPIRRRMRSPGRNYSRSPDENRSRSVNRKQSRSPDIILLEERNTTRFVQRVESPVKNQYVSYGKLSRNQKQRDEGRPLDDLEEISDEDESLYFSSKDKISGTTEFKKLSHPQKMLILSILQGISVNDLDHNDPSVQKMIQFFKSNKAELQQFISQNLIVSTPSGPDGVNSPQVQSSTGFGQPQMPLNSGGNVFPPSGSQGQSTFPFSLNYPPPQKNIAPVPNAFGNQRFPFPQQNQPAWAPPNQMPPNQLQIPLNQLQVPPNQFQLPPNSAPPNQLQMPPNQLHMPPNQMHMPPNQLQMPPNQMHMPPNQLQMGHNQFQMPPNQFQMPMNQLQMPPSQHQIPPGLMDKKNPMHQALPQSREEIAARQQKMAQEQLNMFFQGNLATPAKSIPSDAIFKDFRATVSKLFGEKKSEKKDVSSMIESSASEFKHHSSGFKKSGKSPASDFDYRSVKSGNKNEHKDHPQLSFSEQMRQREERNLSFPPPDAKVAFCDTPRIVHHQTLFPVVSEAESSKGLYESNQENSIRMNDTKVSMAQRLASVLIKIGMTDVSGQLLQEMLMKIGAFSSCPPQDITETDIIYILRKCGYMR